MDGRWKKWMSAGLLAGALGCNRNAVQPEAPPAVAQPQDKPSLLQTAFGSNPKFNPKPPELEPTDKPVRKPGEPIKPDTEVELAALCVGAAFMEGKSEVDRDKLLDAARQGYQRALKTDPKHKGALVGLANLYVATGDKERAGTVVRAAIQANPKDHELAHKMAAVQIQIEDWNGAAESCRFALALDPENRTYNRTLGYCLAQLGQWQEAGESLMKVMSEAQTRYFLGRVLMDQKRTAEGRQMIQAACTLDPQFEAAKEYLTALDSGQLPQKDVKQTSFETPETRPALER